jgi:hypothetical protein
MTGTVFTFVPDTNASKTALKQATDVYFQSVKGKGKTVPVLN